MQKMNNNKQSFTYIFALCKEEQREKKGENLKKKITFVCIYTVAIIELVGIRVIRV